jgi:flagellar basal body rod protein FlgB
MNALTAAGHRMHHSALTLRVASSNMVNLHTPDYETQTVKPLDLSDSPFHTTLCRTNARHIDPARPPGRLAVIKDPEARINSLDGNSVDHATQLQRANAANQAHTQMLGIWQSSMEMLSTALKR